MGLLAIDCVMPVVVGREEVYFVSLVIGSCLESGLLENVNRALSKE